MCMDIYLNKTFYLEAFKKLLVQIFSETSKGVELNFIFCVKFFGGNINILAEKSTKAISF